MILRTNLSRRPGGRQGLLVLDALLSLACALAAASAQAAPFAQVTNLGGGNVSQYELGAGGALTAKGTATVAAGSFPRRVAVSPDGKSAQVTNRGGNSVSQYDVGAGGALAAKSTATVAAGSLPTGIAVSPVTNEAPDCSGVSASPSSILPATRDQLKLVTLAGASHRTATRSATGSTASPRTSRSPAPATTPSPTRPRAQRAPARCTCGRSAIRS